MSVAATLAHFVANAAPDAGSGQAEAVMRLSLYDWMVCGIAGKDEPVARILREAYVPDVLGCPVFGTEATYARQDAALINGATSHALDYDDTHFAHIGHPSVAIFPAALATETSGPDMLWNALVGAEVSVRVGLWLGRSHYQAGFHQTGTAGAFGAAAAAGLGFGLTEAQFEAAFGLAATQAAGLKAQFGTMGKPYHAGLAARTGVEAARLALAGFDTRGAALEGPFGFAATHAGEGNMDAFDGLGEVWRMETVSHKFHACCHGLHAMLAALKECPRDATRLEVFTHPRWLSVCNIPSPTTGLECKFSYRHTAAMALLGHDTAALGSYSDALATASDLVALRERVTVETDEALSEMQTRIVAHSPNGAAQTLFHDLDAPISLEDKADRLRVKGHALLGETEPLVWAATAEGEVPNVDAIADLMQG